MAVRRRSVLLGAVSAVALAGCGTTERPAVNDPLGPFAPDLKTPRLRLTHVAEAIGTLAAFDDHVVVGADALTQRPFQMAVLDARTGKMLWSRQSDEERQKDRAAGLELLQHSGAGPQRLLLSVTRGSDGGDDLIARAPRSGAQVWHRSLPRRSGNLAANSVGLLAYESGAGDAPADVHSLDPATGRTLWTRPKVRLVQLVSSTAVLSTASDSASESTADLVFVDLRSGRDVPVAGLPTRQLSDQSPSGGRWLIIPPYSGDEQQVIVDVVAGRVVRTLPETEPFTVVGAGAQNRFIAVRNSRATYSGGRPVFEALIGDDPMVYDTPPQPLLVRPAAIVDGIVWCNLDGGSVAPFDVSGRMLADPVQGTYIGASTGALCVQRDGGASPSQVYRIDRVGQ